MGQFQYRARDQLGQLIKGEINADDSQSVTSMIAEQGLIPLAVTKSTPSFLKLPNYKEMTIRVKAEELIVFTRQLYTLFKSGMNMDVILQTLQNQSENKHLKAALQMIKNDIASGSSLGKAFSKHPRIFSSIYTSLMSAGERTGILENVLKHMSSLLEKDHCS